MANLLHTRIKIFIGIFILMAPMVWIGWLVCVAGIDVLTVDQPIFNTTVMPLTRNRLITQSLRVPSGEYRAVSLRYGTYKRINTGSELYLTVRFIPDQKESGIIERHIRIACETLIDNAWMAHKFEPVLLPGAATVELDLEGDAFSQNKTVTVWCSLKDQYSHGRLMLNGQPLNGDLAFKLSRRLRCLAIYDVLMNRWPGTPAVQRTLTCILCLAVAGLIP